MDFNLALFDLDGTIIDSAPGVYDCIEYALSKFNIEFVCANKEKYLGPPLRETFSDFLPQESIQAAIEFYREKYSVTGLFECELYDGIEKLLKRLKLSGYKLALATTKPQVFAKRILQHYALDTLFDYIGGSSLDGKIESKTDVLNDVLSQPNLKGCTPVMIGDRYHDLVGAQNCNIKAIGVLYGYGPKKELAAYNPVYLSETTQDLGDYLIANKKGELYE
ncbi:MAG: HAD hydrolase-like protein [Oscillospiraceae bacterium]